MSTLLSTRCKAVRAAFHGNSLSMHGMEQVKVKEGSHLDSSRVLCLEWLPGKTLSEWARTSALKNNVHIESRYESSVRLAWQ
eukprot:8189273-Ditylum_brightwellii.AAC.1